VRGGVSVDVIPVRRFGLGRRTEPPQTARHGADRPENIPRLSGPFRRTASALALEGVGTN